MKAYRDFIEVYTFGRPAGDALKALENIPAESEEAFLRQRKDIRRDEWELGKTAWQNMQKYGAPTWYEWCIKNWGTKWNAYGYDTNGLEYHDGDSLYFQTAWSAPHPILEKLSEKYPDLTFEHSWADEDIGYNCGQRTWLDGKRIDEYIPEGIRAMDFAMELWDYDPIELDLCLNVSGTEYIRLEDEEYQQIELFGKPALFANERLTKADIPEGLYCYHLRRGDDGRFRTIEPSVGAGHCGSVITKEPLDFGENGYIAFTEDTEPSFTGEEQTFGEYIRSDTPEESEVMKLC